MRIIRTLCLALTILFLTNCSKQQPQTPSRWMGKEVKVDSVHLALLELNQKMVEAADDKLTQIAQTKTEPYALYEGNTWIYFIERGDMNMPAPKDGDLLEVQMSVYTIEQEKLLVDIIREYRVGKSELLPAIENNITEFRKGTKARMLVPWYGAFGMKGTKDIPPYENVIINIEIR